MNPEENNSTDAPEAYEVEQKIPPPPAFPWVMFFCAAIKDIFDWLWTAAEAVTFETVVFAVVFWVVSAVASFLIGIALWIWLEQRREHTEVSLRGKLLSRLLFMTAAELLPGIGAIPFSTWFVWNTHRNELKAYREKFGA